MLRVYIVHKLWRKTTAIAVYRIGVLTEAMCKAFGIIAATFPQKIVLVSLELQPLSLLQQRNKNAEKRLHQYLHRVH